MSLPNLAALHHEPHKAKRPVVIEQNMLVFSAALERTVTVDCYLPNGVTATSLSLLLINDGQNMKELGLAAMLEEMYVNNTLAPLLCVAIHAGNRMMEYGTACSSDYKGRGARAGAYTRFIVDELVPFLQSAFGVAAFKEKSFAGFSLGGLSALDIVWNHPHAFAKAGIFSGSMWWRTKDINDGYQEDTDRIMHAQVRKGNHAAGLQFFFEAGTLDETADRNHNGIIDSIDDTLGLIKELVDKGYNAGDIAYLELQNGRHDIATWAKAMPVFLQWGWGRK